MFMMKKHPFKSLAVIPVLFLAVSCGILSHSDDKVCEAAANASVEEGIRISVNTIIGIKGSPIHSSDGYYLSVKDGKAKSHLPFFGEAYQVAGYGTASGIDFDDCPVSVSESSRKDCRIWSFTGRIGHERIDVTIEFYESGSATVTCLSDIRSAMIYHGEVVDLQ